MQLITMHKFKKVFPRVLLILVANYSATVAMAADKELGEAAQKANNPISDAWIFVTQNDYTIYGGDAVDGTENLNNLKFQPVLSVPLADGDLNLVLRPVFQFISSPVDNEWDPVDGLDGRTTGLGDSVLLTLLGPNSNDGVIWGVGPTFIFPTASDDVLGQEKWQAGPAALLARLGNSSGGWGLESWNVGLLAQQWWSYGGDSDRKATSQMDIQYFLNWRQNNVDLIGMTPNIRINWKRDGNDKYSVPVGLGKIGMTRWGKLPVRWGAEIQYYVMQPDPVAAEWNFRVFFAPVIGNPLKQPKVLSVGSEFDRFASIP